ncbi:MAG: LPS export ABC transporter periplasmic protein LptC [Flavobacteriales bacterium CG_4_10_14_0_2_um_filter_32_8]|nr:MAG: LPS export ABC transporter periplasmic protein LptC [Flavobacteriales bacterium CG_4_10_14_0_2_um_filter_32_8]
MTKKKVSLLIYKVIPMLVIFGILYSCENDMKQVESLISQKKIPINKGKNVELIYSEKATVKIKIIAPLSEEYDEKDNHYIEMTEGIKVLFYDSLLNVASTLTSNYAIQQVSKKIMEAKNNVVVINDKGEKLNTEHLIWNEDSSKIYSDVFVKITTKEEIIMGEGMEANQDFSKWKIYKIKGTINIKEDPDSLNPTK